MALSSNTMKPKGGLKVTLESHADLIKELIDFDVLYRVYEVLLISFKYSLYNDHKLLHSIYNS